MSEYLDHKNDKQYKFQQWVRNNIQDLQSTSAFLVAIARAVGLTPQNLAKAVKEEMSNRMFAQQLNNEISKVAPKVGEEKPKKKKEKK